jgi:hypothetical protein
MASIYSNAFLVVGASCARDSSEGFIASPCHKPAVRVANVENHFGTISEVYTCKSGMHGAVCSPFMSVRKRGPLASRGWTLQEQILSNRMVHFERYEMFWECRKRMSCECMELDESDDYPPPYKAALDKEANMTTYDTWRNVVNQYHERSLKFGSDFLPAISGIVTRLQTFGAGVYLAGLWRANLIDELLWSRITWPHTDFFVRAQPYRAPTWSWASLCRYDRNRYIEDNLLPSSIVWPIRLYNIGKQVGRILYAECTPSGRDPNGAVESGTITIEAKMASIVFEKHSPDDPPTATLRAAIHQSLPQFVPKYTFETSFDLRMEDYSHVELYGLFIDAALDTNVCRIDVMIHGIILRQAKQRDDVYERVGYCVVKMTLEDDWEHRFKDSKEFFSICFDKAMGLFSNVPEACVTIV